MHGPIRPNESRRRSLSPAYVPAGFSRISVPSGSTPRQYTQCPAGRRLDPEAWVKQLTGLLDALDIATVSVVGNSFGGAIALALAQRHPQRVKRLVLMGSAGLSFPITEGLEKVWGYQPSLQAMGELMEVFAYDHSLINDEYKPSRRK